MELLFRFGAQIHTRGGPSCVNGGRKVEKESIFIYKRDQTKGNTWLRTTHHVCSNRKSYSSKYIGTPNVPTLP